jgi:hypothetical protein
MTCEHPSFETQAWVEPQDHGSAFLVTFRVSCIVCRTPLLWDEGVAPEYNEDGHMFRVTGTAAPRVVTHG